MDEQRMQPTSHGSLLLTDLYQLTMLQAYWASHMTETAVFELFVRKLPPTRNFLMAAGLDQALDFLESLRFSPEDLSYLRDCGRFSAEFVDWLSEFRFTGDVDALPEGTIFFADEPIIRVTAPLPEAQFVETRLMNILHFQTLIASKAARMVLTAPGRSLVDFGLRRAHGSEAGLMAARAGYIAGFSGTATVLAEPEFGIPVSGTMAHSFVQAHETEEAAFLAFARARPRQLVLLIDTFDTIAAAKKVVRIAPTLKAEGITIHGVRIDSGDLAADSSNVRRILDAGGLEDVMIYVSGGLDEDKLRELVRCNAPIAGFGIGTSLVTSSDAPALDCAYKLQEYAGIPRRKTSRGKVTWPGRKQAWRLFSLDGTMAGDILTLVDDRQPGRPLLTPAMRSGQRLPDGPNIVEIRAFASDQRSRLPESLRGLLKSPYQVAIAPALQRLRDECAQREAGLSHSGQILPSDRPDHL